MTAPSFAEFAQGFPPFDLTLCEIVENILCADRHRQQAEEAQAKLNASRPCRAHEMRRAEFKVPQ